MVETITELRYLSKIYENVISVDKQQLESLYYDILSSRVIVPTGEGRSKGALSIVCSEIAKMNNGKLILDRSDTGFPGRDLYEAAPMIRKKYGNMTLLVNSGSGLALIPLIDAQKLAQYITEVNNNKDYKIDVVTSDPESPLGKLGAKFGTTLILKGKQKESDNVEIKEFKEYGIMGDIFELGSALIFQAIAETLNKDEHHEQIFTHVEEIFKEIDEIFRSKESFEFLQEVANDLEKRSYCFFGGLGSGLEVARMTAVRILHIKRVLGDQVFVIKDTNLPSPRPGDIFIVISFSGETEIVVGWCKTFKKMGGKLISITGNENSTINSLSDLSYVIKTKYNKGEPNRFYLKSAFLLSPLPIFLAELLEKRGYKLPEYILRWYQSVISII